MLDDSCPRVSSSSESMASTDSSATKQRRKRKWDQPAESLVSAGVAVPGILPMGNAGSVAGITLPVVVPVSGTSLMNPLSASFVPLQQVFLAPPVQQNAAYVVQKLNQPKIQEELIAREIVINDAESAIRYKLTKRQTQEEIQKCTGAVVITRGKYRPPNAPPDGEKPLYLHISAGAHLETTAERIKAVDRAAATVEEMLKQGLGNGVKVIHPLSTSVFLGFEADPSLNVAARIRGPNDQYVNHIMNETGATVILRGRGSGNSEIRQGEEEQQALHLFLSSNNPKSLEHAKLLAENLLDTICTECGASRVSSCKVYGAVPPPQQLLGGVQSSGNELKENAIPTNGTVPIPAVSTVTAPGISTVPSQGTVQQPMMVNGVQSQPNMVSYPLHPPLAGGTSYNGYGGIYPQATPLQQVALALRHSTSPVTSTVAPSTTVASTTSTTSTSFYSEKEKRPPQKRKFQELPVASKGPVKPHQVFSLTLYEANRPILDLDVCMFHRVFFPMWRWHGIGTCCFSASIRSLFNISAVELGFLKPRESTPEKSSRNISTMPAPRKLVQSSSNGMPSHPRSMPPPPPKFNSTPFSKAPEDNTFLNKSNSQTVPDTLIGLMEYGDEDDDDLDETTKESVKSNNSTIQATPKPFWAV
ncbi:hypothetical protein LguiB_019620 [Lonicera macranthoides]